MSHHVDKDISKDFRVPWSSPLGRYRVRKHYTCWHLGKGGILALSDCFNYMWLRMFTNICLFFLFFGQQSSTTFFFQPFPSPTGSLCHSFFVHYLHLITAFTPHPHCIYSFISSKNNNRNPTTTHTLASSLHPAYFFHFYFLFA